MGRIIGIDSEGVVLSDPIPGWTIDNPLISGVNVVLTPGDTIRDRGVLNALDWINSAKLLPRVDSWMMELVISGDQITRVEGRRNCNVHLGSHSIKAQVAALDAFLSLKNIDSYQGKMINLEFPEFLILHPREGV